MGLVATFPMQGGQPSRFRHLAERGGVSLPWGGPTGAGGDYLSMSPLQNVGGTAQPEIWTWTLSGSGTTIFQFGAESIRAATPLTTGTATAAQAAAALQTIWPLWCLPTAGVTGGAGGPFTITFAPNARIGGLINFVNTGSAGSTLVRTQRGSCGAGQYDFVDGVINTVCEALLIDQTPLGPTGDLSTQPYGPVSDTTFTPWAWVQGYFFAADAPLLTNAIIASSPAVAFFIGTSVAQAGAEICLTQTT